MAIISLVIHFTFSIATFPFLCKCSSYIALATSTPPRSAFSKIVKAGLLELDYRQTLAHLTRSRLFILDRILSHCKKVLLNATFRTQCQ